jgi:hypothetical protein
VTGPSKFANSVQSPFGAGSRLQYNGVATTIMGEILFPWLGKVAGPREEPSEELGRNAVETTP